MTGKSKSVLKSNDCNVRITISEGQSGNSNLVIIAILGSFLTIVIIVMFD